MTYDPNDISWMDDPALLIRNPLTRRRWLKHRSRFWSALTALALIAVATGAMVAMGR